MTVYRSKNEWTKSIFDDFCIAYHSLIERSKTGNWTSPTTQWYHHRRSLGKAASCSFPDPEGLVLVKQHSCQFGVSVWLPTISSPSMLPKCSQGTAFLILFSLHNS
jgi:hypothetical protein